MELKVLNAEQLNIIEGTLGDRSDTERLIDYLKRNEIVGGEIFPYLDGTKIGTKYEYIYEPVDRETFLRRMPIYFYHSRVTIDAIGEFSHYATALFSDEYGKSNYPQALENLYSTVEKLYYHYKLDLKTIFNYPIDQTGYCSKVHILLNWAHYLDLMESYGISDKTPKNFITAYNYALERAGLKPIIYEIHEQYIGDYIVRNGNILKVEGVFPCDENGNPIMKWIGLDVINPTRIWAKVNARSKGYVYIEANSKTAVFGLNCWGTNDDGSDCWYRLYTGSLLLDFDYERLKECRKREKLTQKQVAEAIGAAERTYQKWESGATTPDCMYLLRLMNVLDIRDVTELTKVNI